MVDEGDARRDKIHEFFQELGPSLPGKTAVLTGWVMVLQWMDDEGETWLSKGHSDSLPDWAARGLYHEALYGRWDAVDEV